MIRTNLSTRPFYNERLVNATLLALLVLVIAATAFNVLRIVQYSHSDTTLALEASRNEARAAELRASAARLRGSLDAKQVEVASNEARLANELIDRRTFSWTELFNRFETTLPDNARITAVRPKIDRSGRIDLSINLVALSVDEVNEFMEKLDATGAFVNLRPGEERINEAQQLEATLEATYVPASAPPPGPAQGGGR